MISLGVLMLPPAFLQKSCNLRALTSFVLTPGMIANNMASEDGNEGFASFRERRTAMLKGR